jgi:outer membrane lipoprotein carrier protein
VDAGASTVAAADAGAPSPGLQMAQKIDAVFAKSKTYSAHFTQKYTMKVTGTEKTSTGIVAMERPNKISFRYDLPSKNRIVSDGITLKVYIADDGQMFETPVAKTEYPGALAFMMGKGIASSFTFSLRPTRYAGVALEGRPLVPNPTYQTVIFLVDTRVLGMSDVAAMTAVILQDAQDNRNRFDFQGGFQPASFPADEFSFTPPPGTKVVRSQ